MQENKLYALNQVALYAMCYYREITFRNFITAKF